MFEVFKDFSVYLFLKKCLFFSDFKKSHELSKNFITSSQKLFLHHPSKIGFKIKNCFFFYIKRVCFVLCDMMQSSTEAADEFYRQADEIKIPDENMFLFYEAVWKKKAFANK